MSYVCVARNGCRGENTVSLMRAILSCHCLLLAAGSSLLSPWQVTRTTEAPPFLPWTFHPFQQRIEPSLSQTFRFRIRGERAVKSESMYQIHRSAVLGGGGSGMHEVLSKSLARFWPGRRRWRLEHCLVHLSLSAEFACYLVLFFSHNKSVNNTFCHGTWSGQRQWHPWFYLWASSLHSEDIVEESLMATFFLREQKRSKKWFSVRTFSLGCVVVWD